MAPSRSIHNGEHHQQTRTLQSRQQRLTVQASTPSHAITQAQSHRSLEPQYHRPQTTITASGSSSYQAPITPSRNTRPLAQEEIQYFETLLHTLNSSDLLTERAIYRNESRPQCRAHIQDEIDTFMSNVTAPSGKSTTQSTGLMLATTSENLVELCMKVGAPPVSSKKITFTELMRKVQENASPKVRKASATQQDGRGTSRTSLSGSSRAGPDDMDLDGEADGLDEGAGASRLGRTKGKQRARRRMWEEEDMDILDALD